MYFLRCSGLIRLIALLAALVSAPAVHAKLTDGEVIDIAGRQRMLSQRMVNLYAQLAQGVEVGDSRAQLNLAVDMFDNQLRTLKESVPEGDAATLLRRVEELWLPFRSVVTGGISREKAKSLSMASEDLLAASQRVVSHLQDRTGTAGARLVNLAGRQRMLSQRIAKDYMLLAMGQGGASLRDELERARYEFEGAMAELHKAKENSPEIAQALAEVDRQWRVFRGSFQLKDSGDYVPLLVAMAGEKILTLLNEITGMYARVAQQQPDGGASRRAAGTAVVAG